MSGKDGVPLPDGWKPNPAWFYDPHAAPAVPVGVQPEPAEEADPMDECHNCGCVRDDHAKIGGSWCMNQHVQGPCGCHAFIDASAVPVVHPGPGDRAAIVDNLRKIARLQEPGYGLLVGEIEAATLAADMLEADAAAVAAVRAELADQILALPNATGAYWAGLKDAAAIVRGGTDGD